MCNIAYYYLVIVYAFLMVIEYFRVKIKSTNAY